MRLVCASFYCFIGVTLDKKGGFSEFAPVLRGFLGVFIFNQRRILTFDVTGKKLRLKLIRSDMFDNERVTSSCLTPVVSGACARDPHKPLLSLRLQKL